MSTLDLSWITEEETLINMDCIPMKTPLTQIEMRFLFVNTESYVTGIDPIRIPLDVSGNVSILPKRVFIDQTELAKQNYISKFSGDATVGSIEGSIVGSIEGSIVGKSSTSSNLSFSIMDVLIWNNNVEHEYLSTFIKTGITANGFQSVSPMPGWIVSESDIVLEPSLSIFHSIQCIIVLFQEDKPSLLHDNKPKHKPKHTKRVRFHIRSTRKADHLRSLPTSV